MSGLCGAYKVMLKNRGTWEKVEGRYGEMNLFKTLFNAATDLSYLGLGFRQKKNNLTHKIEHFVVKINNLPSAFPRK